MGPFGSARPGRHVPGGPSGSTGGAITFRDGRGSEAGGEGAAPAVGDPAAPASDAVIDLEAGAAPARRARHAAASATPAALPTAVGSDAPGLDAGDAPAPDGGGKGAGRHRARDGKQRPQPTGPWPIRLAKDVAFVLVAAIVLSFLLKTFLIQSFYIPSESMEPTLVKWDRVVVTKLTPDVLKVHRGDIVVFHDPDGWVSQNEPLPEQGGLTGALRSVAQAIGLAPADSEDFLIKRVIGVAGDRVVGRGGDAPVTVNGIPIDETYIAPGALPSSQPFDVVVPPNAVWVMGDNRDRSADSRAHMSGPLNGAVSLDNVVGVAQFRTWPFDRMGLLRNPGSVFAGVPNGSGSG